MYESPKDLIRDILPTPIVSFAVVARAAGVLFLASFALPLLSNRIGFAEYTAAFRSDPHPLTFPFDVDMYIIATLGTAGSSVEAYDSGGGGAEGLGVALVDLIFTPLLIFALPITAAIMTAAIPLFGIALLFGSKRYTTHLTLGFATIYSGYLIMLDMKTATIHPQTGWYLMTIAGLIMIVVTVDRIHNIGLISGNGYTHPESTVRTTTDTNSRGDEKKTATRVSKFLSKPSVSLGGDTNQSENASETDDRDTEPENGGDASYGGGVKRSEVDRS